MDDALGRWANQQRDLARALGLSLEAWLAALDAAGRNRAGVTAAVIGASMAQGRGLPRLSDVDGPALARQARALIDPEPPRARHPVVAEAIRRSAQLQSGQGARRLGRPDRAAPSDAPSSARATADAPGREDGGGR